MDKTTAKQLLGGDGQKLGNAMGVSRAAVSKWPDPLPERLANEVLGAALRAGIINVGNFAALVPGLLKNKEKRGTA